MALSNQVDPAAKRQRSDFYYDGNEPADNVPADGSRDEFVRNKIEALVSSLKEKRDRAVRARAACGIEQIWREDELAFEGLDEVGLRTRMIDYATQTAAPRTSERGPKRSKVYINIVRPKCETAEGRFSDIQLPTDSRNWGLKTTPVPDLVGSLQNESPARLKGGTEQLTDESGKPLTIADIAASDISKAKAAMPAMEAEIDDQLTECDYNGECRKVIRNAVRLGTGIMKGPFVVKDLKKSWQKVDDGSGQVVRVFKRIESQQPKSKSKDPWDVFPDPDCKDDIRMASYIWDREAILPRGLRDLVGVPGYREDEIMAVLQEAPTRIMVAAPKENELLIRYGTMPKGYVYEKWEYYGDLDKDDLEALGVDVSDVGFQSVSACVVMVNDHPIKVMLNPLDTGELPYDFFQWTTRSGVPWGIGVPREMAWQQRVIVAAWRAMMDNAGDSSGANVVLSKGVQPMDGKWEIKGKKLWRALGDELDVTKAFAQFQIQNNQKDLQAIIDLALRFIDMETALPMLFQGEKGTLPETLGATNILVDSNNVALRARVKLWDDRITRPHIERYYDWNMQYNENDAIKGDYKVDARGTSYLKERDIEAQSVKDILTIRGDAELSLMVDWEKAMAQLMSARNLDIMLPAEKIKENQKRAREQGPAKDPSIEAAMMRAETELKKAQLVQQGQMEELRFKAEQAQIDREHEMQLRLLDREIKAMELSAASGQTLDKIKAQLSETAAKLKTQVSLARAKDVQPAEQVATPIAEPPGRAPEGQAFQK